MQNIIFYIALMIVAGLGIPTMASLNASLGARLESPLLAVTILLVFALTVAMILLVLTGVFPKAIYIRDTPWYLYCAGALFILYILSVTWVIPKLGVANAIGFVLLGQLIAMSAIDHFGLFGLIKYEMSVKRFCGLIVMALGVFLVLSRPAD